MHLFHTFGYTLSYMSQKFAQLALMSMTNSIDLDAKMTGKTRLTEAMAFSVNTPCSKGKSLRRKMRNSRCNDTLRSDRKLLLERALSSKTQLDVRSGSKKLGFGNASVIAIERLMVCKGHWGDGSERRVHSSMIYLSHELWDGRLMTFGCLTWILSSSNAMKSENLRRLLMTSLRPV